MKISDFSKEWVVCNVEDLHAVLLVRHEGEFNSFWLTFDDDEASMSILTKGDLAYVHFFPKRRHPGFRSQGSVVFPGLQTTDFRLDNPNQVQSILNNSIIPFQAAEEAAKEFFQTRSMPNCIPWIEL